MGRRHRRSRVRRDRDGGARGRRRVRVEYGRRVYGRQRDLHSVLRHLRHGQLRQGRVLQLQRHGNLALDRV